MEPNKSSLSFRQTGQSMVKISSRLGTRKILSICYFQGTSTCILHAYAMIMIIHNHHSYIWFLHIVHPYMHDIIIHPSVSLMVPAHLNVHKSSPLFHLININIMLSAFVYTSWHMLCPKILIDILSLDIALVHMCPLLPIPSPSMQFMVSKFI